jgi:hypothetical protein
MEAMETPATLTVTDIQRFQAISSCVLGRLEGGFGLLSSTKTLFICTCSVMDSVSIKDMRKPAIYPDT